MFLVNFFNSLPCFNCRFFSWSCLYFFPRFTWTGTVACLSVCSLVQIFFWFIVCLQFVSGRTPVDWLLLRSPDRLLGVGKISYTFQVSCVLKQDIILFDVGTTKQSTGEPTWPWLLLYLWWPEPASATIMPPVGSFLTINVSGKDWSRAPSESKPNFLNGIPSPVMFL